jgi:hypothetical protein
VAGEVSRDGEHQMFLIQRFSLLQPFARRHVSWLPYVLSWSASMLSPSPPPPPPNTHVQVLR